MTINLAAAFAFSYLNFAKYCKVMFCRQENTEFEGIASQNNFFWVIFTENIGFSWRRGQI